MTATPTLPNSDSLDTLLHYLSSHQIDDPKIYNHLCTRDTRRLNSLLRALNRTERAQHKPTKHRSRASSRSFKSYQSGLKGKIYEQIAKEILSSVKCFTASTNVQTTTNEIDILVELGPSATWVPALRLWGSHFVCECKFHDTHLTTTWVGKLNTVLQTHNVSVGLLISKKGIAGTGRGTQIHHLLQLLAVATPARFIIPIDFSDIQRYLTGENILSLITRRYVEAKSGIAKFATLAAS